VTVNYALSSSGSSSTSLTISCIPTTIDKTGTDQTVISGVLTSSGSGIGGKTITLQYSDGGAWHTIATTTTLASGAYSYSWDVPAVLANGQYVIKANFAGDSYYSGSSEATGTLCNGGNLFVVPEYLWGGLAALLSCFGALILFKKRGVFSR
jgi:hypothetical protein